MAVKCNLLFSNFAKISNFSGRKILENKHQQERDPVLKKQFLNAEKNFVNFCLFLFLLHALLKRIFVISLFFCLKRYFQEIILIFWMDISLKARAQSWRNRRWSAKKTTFNKLLINERDSARFYTIVNFSFILPPLPMRQTRRTFTIVK